MLETLAGNQTSHAHDSERDLNDPSILFLEDHEDAENTVNPIQSNPVPSISTSNGIWLMGFP